MEETIKVAFRNLSQQKTRTALTLLGVIIGIATIVALVSLGDGMKYSVEERLNQLGADRIIVVPNSMGRSGFGPPRSTEMLSERDVERIKSVSGVELAVPLTTKTLPVDYKGSSRFLGIYAFPADDAEKFFSGVQSYEADEGRFLKDGEMRSVVIGSLVASKIFDKNPHIREKLVIKNTDFRIVGIMKPTGNQQDDSMIIMTAESLQDITGSKDISVVMVKANGDTEKVAKKIEETLARLHKEELFTAMTTQQLMESINQVLSIMTLVLGGIAAISLLVAAFGIMNTMLMSVLERTREIGVMKAIGATNSRVMSIFLAEAMLVGLIGGAAGVLTGAVFSQLVSGIASAMMGITMKPVILPQLVAFSIGFAVFVGALSGIYPARRASRLDPVEALRYE